MRGRAHERRHYATDADRSGPRSVARHKSFRVHPPLIRRARLEWGSRMRAESVQFWTCGPHGRVWAGMFPASGTILYQEYEHVRNKGPHF